MTRKKVKSDKELNYNDKLHDHWRKQLFFWAGTILIISIIFFTVFPFFHRILYDGKFSNKVTDLIADQSGTLIVAAVSIFVALVSSKKDS